MEGDKIMMNLSELLTAIKMDLGIYGLALPFKDPDKTLYDVIKLRTIKTFSPFMPNVIKLPINLSDLNCLQSMYTESIYEIPDVFGGRTLLYIRKVNAKNKLLGAGYLSPILDTDINLYNQLAMVQASANLVSTVTPPLTFKFTPPNLLHLFNFATAYGEVDIEFALEHAANLSTVTPTMWESFYELALIDIKRFLYGTLKHYTDIQTAYGTINLRIDEWQNAEQDRKELVERWRDTYHLETEQFFII